MDRATLPHTTRSRLQGTLGGRLRGVVIHGSEARGDARNDRAVDVRVPLDGPVHLGDDLDPIVHSLYPLQLEVDRIIEAFPVAYEDYEAGRLPIYRNAKREGVLL